MLPLLLSLVVAPEVITLGAFSEAESRRVSFSIRNESAHVRKIARIVSSCDCLEISSFPHSLAPQERKEITATLRPYTVTGTFERTILVFPEEGDPHRVTVIGRAIPLVKITCNAPTFLPAIEPDTCWTGRYTLLPTQTGISLGRPRIENQKGASTTYTLQTAAAGWTLDRIVRFSGKQRQRSVLVIPLCGLPDTPPPIRLEVEAGFNSSFRIKPGPTILPSTRQSLQHGK